MLSGMMRDFALVRDKSTTLGGLIDMPWQSVRCHSTMAQITIAHASMACPAWRIPVWHVPVRRSSGVALFRYSAFQYGAGPVRRISVCLGRQFKVIRQHCFAALFSSSSVVLRG